MTCEEILKKLRKEKAKGEIFSYNRKSTNLKFEFNELKSIKGNSTFERALRLIKDGRLGFSTTTDANDVQRLHDMALESSKFGRKALFDFPNENANVNMETCFEDTVSISLKRLTAIAEEIINAILKFESKAIINIDIGIEKNDYEIVNDSGFHNKTTKTEYYIVLDLQYIDGSDILEISAFKSSFKPEIDHKKIIDSTVNKLKNSRKIVKPTRKEIPVIFSPEGNLTILLPLIAALNGENIYKKTSPLTVKKLGRKLFDSKLSIKDSGITNDSTKSSPFDDEGTPKGELTLIEKGALSNFYVDLQTSKQLSLTPSGNGLKTYSPLGGFSIGSLPSPGINSLIIEEGKLPIRELLNKSSEALIVDSVLGLGQGNIIAGDFSNNILLGFLVKNGEIAGRVKDAMIFGNIYNVLKDELLISSEREWGNGFILSPWVFVSGISLVY